MKPLRKCFVFWSGRWENTQGPFSLRVERWRSTSLVLKVFKIVDKVQFGRTVGKSGCIPLPRVL